MYYTNLSNPKYNYFYIWPQQKEEVKHMYWITGTTGILGLLLITAPFILGYASNTAAMWTSIIVGLLTLAVSFLEVVAGESDRWEYWVAALTGLGAMVLPFLFRFEELTVASWMIVATGFVVATLASTKLFYEKKSFR